MSDSADGPQTPRARPSVVSSHLQQARTSRRALLAGAAGSLGALALAGRAHAQTSPEQPAPLAPAVAIQAAGAPPRLTAFRLAEVTLLFAGGKAFFQADSATDPNDVSNLLKSALRGIKGVRLYGGDLLESRAKGQRRKQTVFTRNGRSYVLVTINLAGWTQDLEPQFIAGRITPELDAAMRVVADTVSALSATPAPFVVDQDHPFMAASPNWLLAASCSWGPSSGGRPVPPPSDVDPLNPPRFRRAETEQAVNDVTGTSSHGNGVRIAILDTWPTKDSAPDDAFAKIEEAAQAPSAEPALAAVVASGSEWRQRLVKFKDVYAQTAPSEFDTRNANENGLPEDPFDLRDHGLCVASIIRDIAPDADIAVYRVFSDKGVTDIDTIAIALKQAIEDTPAGTPLALNLSLGLAAELHMVMDVLADPATLQNTPVLTALHQRDHAAGYLGCLHDAELVEDRTDVPGKLRFAGPLAIVDTLFTMPPEGRVLAVAAAGNDSANLSQRYPGRRLPPRLPAAIEGVLGVSATAKPGGGLAPYSNADDLETARDDGISAFGGSARLSGDGINTLTDVAPVGLYTAAFYPGDHLAPGLPNNTGLAMWAGTSFATPIVAAIAACIWSANPGLSSQDVLTAVVSPGGVHREITLPQV